MGTTIKNNPYNSEIATEELIAEYNALRQEVIHNYGKQINMFVLSVTATGAILGYLWSASNHISSLAYLAPLAILTPCALIIISLRNANDRLNSYIRVFLETETHFLRFETVARKFPYPTSLGRRGYISVYQAMVLSQIALEATCLALMLYYGLTEGDLSVVVIAIGAVIAVFAIALCASYMIYSESRFSTSKLAVLWVEIKDAISADESAKPRE